MNSSEILLKLRSWDAEEIADGYFSKADKERLIEEFGKYQIVAKKGGEDEGTEYWKVYYFEEHDVYIKVNGYYSSYEGVSDIEMFEVFPKEVTITIYQKNKS